MHKIEAAMAFRIATVMLLHVLVLQGQGDPVQMFEQKIRPVLTAKCQLCHNEQLKTSGLSLVSRESVLQGGKRGPAVIPNQPEHSLLLAAIEADGALQMPPTGALSPEQVASFRTWIANGAVWGENARKQANVMTLWSFQPIRRIEPPKVHQTDWVHNPIDNFILARLEQEGLMPSPEADHRTLIRRLSLDLTGLLPTPGDVQSFVGDDQSGAYERLVDHLLNSPHYGERWGRHWLDIARYADTNGYSIDGPRSIWRYRDWVIQALNGDMPFDQFVIEQLAGDLLPEPTESQLVATGFHRNTMINQEGGIDFEQYRVEAVVDRVSTTSAAFMGLTLGCARCHDHKFDPISQREFYQMYAFFNNIDELDGNRSETESRKNMMHPLLEIGSPADFAKRNATKQRIEELESGLTEYQIALESDWDTHYPLGDDSAVERAREIVEIPRNKRSSIQKEVLKRFLAGRDEKFKTTQESILALSKEIPKIDWTMIMRELPEPRETYIHVQGDFTRKGEPVSPNTLEGLPALPPYAPRNRLGLAQWLVSGKNPLPQRVTMNRIWQRYFGLGIVETESDFGSQGSAPSHPELLDWLASEFVERGWSLKQMHRLIVLSATYRQSSTYRPDATETDSSNRLLARQNRLRLEAEIIRDAALSASGLLADTVGGPSVYPPQPEGAGQFTQVDRQWKADEGPDRFRRGMYTFFIRSAAHPGLALFDSPNAQETVTRRNRSNTPLQALTLLNDDSQTEFADGLAQRIIASSSSMDSRINNAFEICLSRPPQKAEQERMQQFVGQMKQDFEVDTQAAQSFSSASAETAAWTAMARVMLNLDEFVTRQ